MLITLNRAKQQLVIEDNEDDSKIEALIPQAIGLVVSDIGRDIYQSAIDVPENAEYPIVLDELNQYHKACLETAVLLQISSLWLSTEATSEKTASETPAYRSATRLFTRSLLG